MPGICNSPCSCSSPPTMAIYCTKPWCLKLGAAISHPASPTFPSHTAQPWPCCRAWVPQSQAPHTGKNSPHALLKGDLFPAEVSAIVLFVHLLIPSALRPVGRHMLCSLGSTGRALAGLPPPESLQQHCSAQLMDIDPQPWQGLGRESSS